MAVTKAAAELRAGDRLELDHVAWMGEALVTSDAAPYDATDAHGARVMVAAVVQGGRLVRVVLAADLKVEVK